MTFIIYERFYESLNERPVPLSLTFTFERDTEESEAFQLWLKYGKPVTLPAKIDIDLPGGLGGQHDEATVSISPSLARSPYRLRCRLVSSTRDRLAQLDLQMEPSSSGTDGTGLWARGADSTGVFRIESRIDLNTKGGELGITFGELTGVPVNDALNVSEFLIHWKGGNMLEVSREQGPFSPLLDLADGTESPVDPLGLQLLRALGSIQEQSHDVILVPDLSQMTRPQVAKLMEASPLLRGQTLVGIWDEISFTPYEAPPDCKSEIEVLISRDYYVELGSSMLHLGVSKTKLTSARIHSTEAGYVLRPAASTCSSTVLDVDAAQLAGGSTIVYRRPTAAQTPGGRT